MSTLIFIMIYGALSCGIGLLVGYFWGKNEGAVQEYERQKRLSKLNNRTYK